MQLFGFVFKEQRRNGLRGKENTLTGLFFSHPKSVLNMDIPKCRYSCVW